MAGKSKIGRAEIINAFYQTLKGFGYTDLTLEQTEKATEQALAGQHEGNIIAMFIFGWLSDEYKDLRPMLEQKDGLR